MTANLERTMTRVPFSVPDITEAEIEAVVDVLRSGWLTTGPKVGEFQHAFSEYIGVPHAVALNSATAALHLALDAIGVGPADEVIVPTYTFAASAEVIRYFGARPVFVDVRPEDLNLDVEAVGRAVGPKTRAVMGVDLAGQPCDWHLLRPLAERHGFALVDDAAHALPSNLRGRAIGSWADVTAFSFYATKAMTTGEGGMLVTANESWARRAQSMSLHGLSRDAWNRYSAEGAWYYEIMAPGFKYNMTDIAAALGLVQLRRLDQMNERRASIARRYTAALNGFAELEVPEIRADRSSSWHLYILRLNLEQLRCDRAGFIEALDQERVSASVHFIPLHLHPYYRETFGYRPTDFPVAYREYQRVVSLPIYSRMSDDDVHHVIGAVTRVVAANRR
jgi:dTDP-4-amino-4,6-dideoxygalactose transaminase